MKQFLNDTTTRKYLKNAKDGDVGCPHGTARLHKIMLTWVNDTPIKRTRMMTETRKNQNISRSHVQVAQTISVGMCNCTL